MQQFLILALIACQLFQSIRMLSQVIHQTSSQWYTKKLNQKFGSQPSKEKSVGERKFENELKHIQDELNEIINNLKNAFGKRFSKNLVRVIEKNKKDYEKDLLIHVELFNTFQGFFTCLCNGLKHHFQINLAKFEQAYKSFSDWYLKSFQDLKQRQI